jgi:hypothetical protein
VLRECGRITRLTPPRIESKRERNDLITKVTTMPSTGSYVAPDRLPQKHVSRITCETNTEGTQTCRDQASISDLKALSQDVDPRAPDGVLGSDVTGAGNR